MDIADKPAAASNEIDRPVAERAVEPRVGQRRDRRDAAPARHPLHRLNPGASYRGLHDSLVNYLGNTRPADAPVPARGARGRARARLRQGDRAADGRRVHSNVGLMHATMAIFNALCDRVPMVVLGATGPLDAARRPWIDWIHTARDQAALIRDLRSGTTSRARSAAARVDRARRHDRARPPQARSTSASTRRSRRTRSPTAAAARASPAIAPPAAPAPCRRARAAGRRTARRRRAAADARSAARRATRRRGGARGARRGARRARRDRPQAGAAFPTGHPLHAARPAAVPAGVEAAARGRRGAAPRLGRPRRHVAHGHAGKAGGSQDRSRSVDQYVHNGWSKDYYGLPPVDVCCWPTPTPRCRRCSPRSRRAPNAPALPAPRARPGRRRCRRRRAPRSSGAAHRDGACTRRSATPRRPA